MSHVLEKNLKIEKDLWLDRIRQGDETAFAELCREYDPLIRSMASKFAHMTDTADEDQAIQDFSQDATLALYRAAKSYEPDSGNGKVTFGLYAKVCIRNALISEIRRLNKKKKADAVEKRGHQGVSSVSYNGISPSDIDLDSIVSRGILSPFERKVFALYAGGMKIRDIAAEVGRTPKSVSNAVFRIKSKLRISLGENEDV